MISVVIFGKGKVGQATAHALTKHNADLCIDWVDPAKGLDFNYGACYDVAIICVSSLEQSFADHAAIESCLAHLRSTRFKGVVAIRSTITPEWVRDRLTTQFSELNVVHFPEFMKQHGDHINDKPWVVVLGGNGDDTASFKQFLLSCGYGKEDGYLLVDVIQSSIVKLGQNAFLATKVAYFNMVADVCRHYNVDYGPVQCGITVDDRINAKHTDVPGWDGELGYGGHCLPKDTMAFAKVVNHVTDCEILPGVITYNGRIR